MEWLVICVLWVISLFCSYKFGKVIESKNDALEESEDRNAVILAGNRAGADAARQYLDRVSK